MQCIEKLKTSTLIRFGLHHGTNNKPLRNQSQNVSSEITYRLAGSAWLHAEPKLSNQTEKSWCGFEIYANEHSHNDALFRPQIDYYLIGLWKLMGKMQKRTWEKSDGKWIENDGLRMENAERETREREREMNRSVEAQSKSNSASRVSARPKAAQLDRDIGKTENYFIIWNPLQCNKLSQWNQKPQAFQVNVLKRPHARQTRFSRSLCRLGSSVLLIWSSLFLFVCTFDAQIKNVDEPNKYLLAHIL